jgi:hypothetical protein
MSYFRYLAYVAGGVGAVVLAPMTGGSSLALAIGALGTTTAAGAAIGASVGVTAAAIDYAVTSKDEARNEGKAEGMEEGKKAGERAAQEKYEQKMTNLIHRFQGYHDLELKLVGMYAIGLAIANADGNICKEEIEELDLFVSGCLAGHLPDHVKKTIAELRKIPPTFIKALEFAREGNVPKEDIDDIIDVVAYANKVLGNEVSELIKYWQTMSDYYHVA